MIKFKTVEFPEDVRKRLVKAGATPLAAMQSESDGRTLRLILSDDPMQSKNCVERHLSVSAWNNQEPSRPTFSEVAEAVQATGLDANTAEFFGGQTGGVVHLFAKT
jgi:hypothetical protein